MSSWKDGWELLGMEHPLVMARFQAGLDAQFCRRKGIPLEDAITMTYLRMQRLFGPDIPRELVEIPIAIHYGSFEPIH